MQGHLGHGQRARQRGRVAQQLVKRLDGSGVAGASPSSSTHERERGSGTGVSATSQATGSGTRRCTSPLSWCRQAPSSFRMLPVMPSLWRSLSSVSLDATSPGTSPAGNERATSGS